MITSAIYSRVSNATQHTENQLEELRGFADRNGWPVLEYLEEASAEQGDPHPVLEQLLKDAKAGKFQTVICWKMDRFGRSVKDFIHNIEILNDAGVRFVCSSQPIDTDQRSPFGRMLVELLKVLAGFERDLIAERIQLGVARSLREQAEAVKAGRVRRSRSGKNLPHGAPRKVWRRERVVDLRAQGMSIRKMAAELGTTYGSVRRVLKEPT
jgi:putative DNA-invertase from lambdoid prophage Rac